MTVLEIQGHGHHQPCPGKGLMVVDMRSHNVESKYKREKSNDETGSQSM
jgi:hypothetical protein